MRLGEGVGFPGATDEKAGPIGVLGEVLETVGVEREVIGNGDSGEFGYEDMSLRCLVLRQNDGGRDLCFHRRHRQHCCSVFVALFWLKFRRNLKKWFGEEESNSFFLFFILIFLVK